MSTQDIHKAICTVWDSSGLDTLFKSYWPAGESDCHVSLDDTEAAAGIPFPYAVYEAPRGLVRTRMSDSGSKKRVLAEQPWTFHVYAKKTASQSAKYMAAMLANEITKVFGGHPTSAPTALTLDNGSVVNVQYQGDHGARAADDVHEWTVEYQITTDVPIMV